MLQQDVEDGRQEHIEGLPRVLVVEEGEVEIEGDGQVVTDRGLEGVLDEFGEAGDNDGDHEEL